MGVKMETDMWQSWCRRQTCKCSLEMILIDVPNKGRGTFAISRFADGFPIGHSLAPSQRGSPRLRSTAGRLHPFFGALAKYTPWKGVKIIGPKRGDSSLWISHPKFASCSLIETKKRGIHRASVRSTNKLTITFQYPNTKCIVHLPAFD